MTKVAVVILNWNGKNLLEKFLPTVIKYSLDCSKIYIVDNASTDSSVEFLFSSFPSVSVIKNDKNYGFAKGYNEGLKHIEAEYFVLLNSDVEVSERWIEPIVKLMDSDKSIAACQPKILSYNQRDTFEYAGAAGGFIDKYGYTFCRGRIFNSFEKDEGQYNDYKEIFWATGASLFIRAEYYRKVNGLDEDFYAHMEEIDLCWRLKNLGYKIMYCPDSYVHHLGGATLSKINPHKTYLNFRNNLILFFKNHSSNYFWIKVFLRMKLDGIAAIKFLFSGEFSHFIAVFKAHLDFYLSFSTTLKKRKNSKKTITTYSTSAVYRKSILVDYFLLKKKKFQNLDQSLF